jgi:hypothetical protein
MQRESLMRVSRKQGPDAWQFRWSEKDLNGRRVYRKRVLGWDELVRLAVSLASTRCWPTCAKRLPEVNQSASINIDFTFCISPSPPGDKALEALSLYP